MEYLTICLDIAGVVLLSFLAYIIWPPLTLLVLAVACLLASWSLSRRPSGEAQ